jgi:enoyl-CoA hydratase
MPDGLRLEHPQPGVALLRLDRPDVLNALTDDLVRDIGQALDAIAADDHCRVLVLTGEGRGFCAGFDLRLAASAPGEAAFGEAAAWMARQEAFSGLITRMRALRVPVIAAVNGPANGGGLALALGAEIRIAARSASFNAAFVKVGMSGCDMGVSWLLPRCVGLSNSFHILLTGRMVGAEEALRIGLVSELVDDAQLLPRALALASEIAGNDAFGVWMTKRGAWANAEAASLQAAMELENRTQMLARTTGQLARAAERFAASRKK